MRADRLLTLVSLLRRHGQLSAQELADRLEVSRRTILRDLDLLSLSGVPVYAVPGRGGGFALLPGYRPDATGLTPAEVAALAIPGGERAAEAIGQGAQFRSARSKLERTLTDTSVRGIGDLSRWLAIVPEGWGEPAPTPPLLADLAGACADGLVVEVEYAARGQPIRRRRVDPIGLVLAGPTWYLLGYRDDGEQRTYRVDRVTGVQQTGERGAARTDVVTAWERARRDWGDRGDLVVQVRTTPAHRGVVRYLAGLAGSVRSVAEQPDGSVLVTASAKLEPAVALLAGLGHRGEVLGPPEVIAGIAAVCADTLARTPAGE